VRVGIRNGKTASFRVKALGPLLWLAPALLAGCALENFRLHEPPPRFVAADNETAECARFFTRLDRATTAAGVADGQDARVAGFPYLRVNRFLAGAWRPKPDDSAFALWVQQLRQLDTSARLFEFNNLSAESRASLADDPNPPREIHQRVVNCAALLTARDLDDPQTRIRLYRDAITPDDYRLLYRTAGIYPLPSIPFYAGVKRLHEVIRRDFAPSLETLPVFGRLVRYRPDAAPTAESAEVAGILRRAGSNALGVPLPSAGERARLFQAFTPIFEIDVVQNDDRIGRPQWASEALPSIDTSQPAVFTYLSHVRFESKTLLQLNYVIWFPARPGSGPLDILAGRLDGINWRVTLDTDGMPLLYDSMHNCGCYHMFMPSEKLRFIGEGDDFEEPALIPQTLLSAPGRLVLRIASRTHYLQRAYFGTAKHGERYVLADYDTLRSLSFENDRRRSLFGHGGMVAGTERLERWLFWPMGIENPGAMRQRGRHATAFVGRRHFDDPTLISRYFRRQNP